MQSQGLPCIQGWVSHDSHATHTHTMCRCNLSSTCMTCSAYNVVWSRILASMQPLIEKGESTRLHQEHHKNSTIHHNAQCTPIMSPTLHVHTPSPFLTWVLSLPTYYVVMYCNLDSKETCWAHDTLTEKGNESV
jgi:hypothetical protein